MIIHPKVKAYLTSQEINLNLFQEHLLKKTDNKLQNTLIVAPTGIGKTLGASLLIFNDWLQNNSQILKKPQKKTKKYKDLAIWISPLKALSRNLVQQLERYWNPLWTDQQESIFLTKKAVSDRTGDTDQTERRNLLSKPPFILCTTPESLFSLVVQKGARKVMSAIKYVIVDELHSLAESKRGVLLTLTLEALNRITSDSLIRIGLSATVANLDWMGTFLVGPKRTINLFNEVRFDKTPELELATRVHKKIYPSFGYGGGWLAGTIKELISLERTILVFTTTRSATERLAVMIKSMVNDDLALRIATHHSALSLEERFFVETGLRHNFLKAVMATASLELGVDIGAVDEVILVASPGSTNRALQRLGRARHNPIENPKGQIFATNFYDFLVAIVLYRQIMVKKYSPVESPVNPLDVLIQFIFGLAIQNSFTRVELEEILDNTLIFQNISKKELDQCLNYCLQGGNSLGVYEEYKRLKKERNIYSVNSTRIAKRFQRLFYQNIGTIVEEDRIPVISKRGRRIGVLEEGSAMKLEKGDIIALAGKSFKVEGFRKGQIVVNRTNRSPTIPRWGKTRMPHSNELIVGLRILFNEIKEQRGQLSDDWLTKDHIAIVKQLYKMQSSIAPWPSPDNIQIELYDLRKFPKILPIRKISYPYLVLVYTFAGLQANHTLCRLVAHRLEKDYGVLQCRLHTDELVFSLFADQPFPTNPNDWKKILSNDRETLNEIEDVVERSHALKIAFKETSLLGQMILRRYYGEKKTGKQLRLSHDLLFDVLSEHEPDHPLLMTARNQVKHQFLHVPKALNWLLERQSMPIEIFLPSKPPPLSLPVLVHGWVDWSTPGDPLEAIEAVYTRVMAEYVKNQE
jgi:ATP-dependent Lhr-like helicase